MSCSQATFAACLLVFCCRVSVQAQSALPNSPDSPSLRLPVLTRMAQIHGFNALYVEKEPMPSMRALSPPTSSTPPYTMRRESEHTAYKASSYVAVDSWVYPALERLVALGYIWTGSLTIRP